MDNDFFNLTDSTQLTLEQEFQMKLFEQSAERMSHEQALSLLMEASKLLMVKDNIIKELMRQNLSSY